MKSEKNKKLFSAVLVIISFALAFCGLAYVFGNYAGAFQTKIWLEKNGEVDFDETVIMRFSDSMMTNNFQEFIEIIPAQRADYRWEDSNKTLKITPQKNWELGKRYTVKINGLKNIFFVSNNKEFSFSTVSYPEIKDFYPENGAKEIIIDIESPGKIYFDKTLKDFNLKIKVFPEKKLAYNINEAKNSIFFTFRDGYERGQEYKIDIFIKHKKEDKNDYRDIYSSSFQTESPPPEEWGDDFASRIEKAKKFTKARMEQGKYIDINLNIQVLTIFENGSILDSFLISSGKRGMETPKGEFKISNKHPRPWSRQYGLFMPYWMAIVPSGKFGIHELPEWPGGYKEGQNHLGIPVSHGCVRLGVGAAKKVYDWAEIGTPVVIY
ncbi:MAG: L,D-transpeptidase family protein [Candidatus Moranbacteria bacterium]|jgi:hypothetical protein|nr:L,D-transpeptidase family protein [Candidatus Moranbacteria bacterium]MDX9855680.1 L,D-transpeptidase family protein [Candidatus Moranbacteria bacterium]